MAFVKAVKSKAKLRMAITGPSGSGKTYTALRISKGLSDKVALIDSEYCSASKYASTFDFDTSDISGNKHPAMYVNAIKEAEQAGYDVLIIDSLTHAWEATKAEVDKVAKAQRTPNTYTAWSEGTKIWDSLKNAINSCKCHVIVTMRAKTDYIQGEENGKKFIRKVGMAPEVRDGTEYEYDVVMDMTHDHWGCVSKTRCESVDNWSGEKPSEEFGKILLAWLNDGADAKNNDDAQQFASFESAMKDMIPEDRKEALDQFLQVRGVASLDKVPKEHRQAFYKAFITFLNG